MALTTGFSLPKFNWRRGKQSWDRHTWLYVSVLLAVVLGAVVGLVWPEVGQAFEPLGKGFVALINVAVGLFTLAVLSHRIDVRTVEIAENNAAHGDVLSMPK